MKCCRPLGIWVSGYFRFDVLLVPSFLWHEVCSLDVNLSCLSLFLLFSPHRKNPPIKTEDPNKSRRPMFYSLQLRSVVISIPVVFWEHYVEYFMPVASLSCTICLFSVTGGWSDGWPGMVAYSRASGLPLGRPNQTESPDSHLRLSQAVCVIQTIFKNPAWGLHISMRSFFMVAKFGL